MFRRWRFCLMLIPSATLPMQLHAQGYQTSRVPAFADHDGGMTMDNGLEHGLPSHRDMSSSYTVRGPQAFTGRTSDRTIRGPDAGMIGRYDPEGRIYDRRGNMIGRVTNGVISSDRGEIVGRLDRDGQIYDARGGMVAHVTGHTLSSASGQVIGHVDPGGRVSDDRGNWIGRVPENEPLAAYLLLSGRSSDTTPR